jgi:hypothetical protein
MNYEYKIVKGHSEEYLEKHLNSADEEGFKYFERPVVIGGFVIYTLRREKLGAAYRDKE